MKTLAVIDNLFFSFFFPFFFMYRFLLIVFQVLDDDSRGCLDRAEIREAFDAVLQMTLTDAEFDAAVKGMNQAEDGSVSFQEFRKFFKHAKKRKDEIMAQRSTTKVVPVESDVGETKAAAEILHVDQIKQDKTDMTSIKTITNIKKPRQVFEQFDTDKNGSLNRTETRAALSQLGCTMADEAFDKMFNEFDKSKDGTIDYKEFKTTL